MELKKNIYYTILHVACRTGNLELVQYIISLNKINLNILNIYSFISNRISYYFCIGFKIIFTNGIS